MSQPGILVAPTCHAQDTMSQPGILVAPTCHAQDTMREPDRQEDMMSW